MITKTKLPIPIARGVMQAMPKRTFGKFLHTLMKNMASRHPDLFRNLNRVNKVILFIEPSDLTHRFVLQFGQGEATLHLADGTEPKPDAVIKGKLSTLVSLLEGSIDSDTLFFTRDLQIIGDTSVVVALRNILDREEMDILDDVLSVTGPFARPLRTALSVLERVALEAKGRMPAYHEALHRAETGARNWEAEHALLRIEIKALQTRLAKFELKQKRTAG